MFRIALAECIHEISSFNPVPTRYDDFIASFGPDLLARHRNVTSEVAGAVDVFSARSDVAVVPTYGIRGMTSGGPVDEADFARIAEEYLSSLRKAGPLDAACLVMHGAIATLNEDDCTGYLLAEARKILGERTPIVVSMDLHGILNRRILQNADAVVPYHTYPHVDFFTTGQRVARLLLKILDGQARPVTARVTIPALVRGDELITATGSFGLCTKSAATLEQTAPGLSAACLSATPSPTSPSCRLTALSWADGDEAFATREAERLATTFWQHHEKMFVPLTSLEESVRLAKAETTGTVALTDAADATSSGASGDSNVIVRALVEGGYTGRVLAPIVDAPAVESAFKAGIGATIQTTIGGSLDPKRFPPLPITATVRLLSDGRFINESHGSTWNSGGRRYSKQATSRSSPRRALCISTTARCSSPTARASKLLSRHREVPALPAAHGTPTGAVASSTSTPPAPPVPMCVAWATRAARAPSSHSTTSRRSSPGPKSSAADERQQRAIASSVSTQAAARKQPGCRIKRHLPSTTQSRRHEPVNETPSADPVALSATRLTSAGVPSATIRPPSAPAPGPRSIIQSDAAISPR